MDSRPNLGIEKLVLVEPDKSGRVLQQKMGLASQNRDGVG